MTVGLQQYRPTPDELSISSRPFRPDPTFSADVNLVPVEVVVHQSGGKIADGLTAKDFTVRDNGKPQQITQFSILRQAPPAATEDSATAPVAAPAAAPLLSPPPAVTPATPPAAAGTRYIGFFLDDASTEIGDLVHAREAVRAFVGTSLPRDEQIAIATVSSIGSLEFTQDAESIRSALNKVGPHRGVDGATCPPLSGFEAQRIVDQTDYDLLTEKANEALQQSCGCSQLSGCITMVQSEAQMVWQASKQQSQRTMDALASLIGDLAHRPGKRTVVLASDGFLLTFDLQPQMEKLIDDALRDGVVVNSLDAKGVAASSTYDVSKRGSGQSGRFAALSISNEFIEQSDEAVGMSDLAYSTGGSFFQGSNDLRHGVRELSSPPELIYQLGFLPNDLKPDGSLHTLSVSVTAPGHFDVQARRGYVAPDKADSAGIARQEKLRQEVMARDIDTGIGLDEAIRRTPQGAPEIVLKIDPRKLPLLQAGGRHRDRVDIVTALFNGSGAFVTGVETTLLLNLRDETLQHFTHPDDGVSVGVPLPVASATYNLRIVAVESEQGLTGSVYRQLVLQK